MAKMTAEEFEKFIEDEIARMPAWAKPLELPWVPLTYKRLTLWAARIGRKMASVGGTTPARADMLIAIRYEERRQSELRVDLGVCRNVVSRMLIAMEALGLVERRVDPDDERQRLVSITDKGLCVLEEILRRVPRPHNDANVHFTAEDTLRRVYEPLFVVADIEAKAPSIRDERTLCRWLQTVRPPKYYTEDFQWHPMYYEAAIMPADAQRKPLPLTG